MAKRDRLDIALRIVRAFLAGSISTLVGTAIVVRFFPEIAAAYDWAVQIAAPVSALSTLPLFIFNLLLGERRIKKTEELLGGKLDVIDKKLDKLETMDKKLDKLDKLETMDKKLDKLDDISETLKEMRDTLREMNGKLNEISGKLNEISGKLK